MMKTVKHLSVLLAVLLTVSLLVVGFAVNAAEPAVTAIETEEQLLAFVNGLNNGTVAANTNAALKADITLTNGMDMINPAYTGTFDGEGHTISGINNTMFKEFQGTIKNVIFRGAIDYTEKTDIRWPATVALEAKNGTAVVENIISYVDITSKCSNINAGGIVGYAKHNFTMRNCEYAGNFNLNWAGSNAGYAGLVGWINTSNSVVLIEDCVFTGTLTLDVNSSGTMYIGGIAGHIGSSAAGATIKNCVNLGTIKVNDTNNMNIWVGGIVSKFNTNNKHVIEGCVNNGQYDLPTMIPVSGILGMCEDPASAGSTVKNCVSLNDSGFIFDGLNEATVINSFAQKDVEKIGEPVVVNGEAYQQYNFGYLNVATSKLYSKLPAKRTSFSAGTITEVEATKYTIDSNDFSAFISVRKNLATEKYDYRVLLAADVNVFAAAKNADLVLEFCKDGKVIKTVTKNIVTELDLYASATAAGNTYTAAEGALLTGIVITDAPADAWDTVTVTVMDETPVATGQIAVADILADKEPDYTNAIDIATKFTTNCKVTGFETQPEHGTNSVFAMRIQGDATVWNTLTASTTTSGTLYETPGLDWIVNINGTDYPVSGLSIYYFGEGNGYFRIGLGVAFEEIQADINPGTGCEHYEIKLRIVTEGTQNVVYYYNTSYALQKTMITDAARPADLITVNPSDVTCTAGPNIDGGEGAKKAFDGNVQTKICTGDNGIDNAIIVKFNATKALKGISLVNANDNETSNSRTVVAFDVYVSADGENWGAPVFSTDGAGVDKSQISQNYLERFYSLNGTFLADYVKLVINNGGLYQFSEVVFYESSTQNITLPATGLKEVSVDVNSVVFSNEYWASNPPKDAFDGESVTTKLGTNKAASQPVTLEFSLNEAATITYYTFWSGNDTIPLYAGRNPKAWVVYGKVGEEWVILSEVTNPGMVDHWATPYSYKVTNPVECKDYKIVFETSSDVFQLAEIELFKNDATVTSPNLPAVMGDAVIAFPHALGYNADVYRIRTTNKADLQQFGNEAMAEITKEGAYVWVKDVTNNGEYIRYEVKELETSRHCDMNFILEGFTPVAGNSYEFAVFFMTGNSAKTPNALHVLRFFYTIPQ